MIRFIATPILSQDIKPGQLFSTAGPVYWEQSRDPLAIGEKVYIRTDAPTPEAERDQTLFVITIEED